MKFFGEFTLHDVEGHDELWKLHNPISENLWGVEIDSDHKVVPCDNFVTDLSSSGIAKGIYPTYTGKKAAVIHDWGYRVHKQESGELHAELFAWFDSMEWDAWKRQEYIEWLRARPREEWDRDYYILGLLEGVNGFKCWLAWRVLRLLGMFAWYGDATNKTQAYRLNH